MTVSTRIVAGASTPARSMREKIVFDARPCTVALETEGRQVRSMRGGPDEMYLTLAGGRCAYVPLDVASAIAELDIALGEPFTIKKTGREWEVNRIEGAPAGRTNAPNQTTDTQQRTPPAAAVNGAGETAAAILAGCYSTAVDVVVGAIADSKTKGLHVAPTFEDLRCIAATLFIQQTGGRS